MELGLSLGDPLVASHKRSASSVAPPWASGCREGAGDDEGDHRRSPGEPSLQLNLQPLALRRGFYAAMENRKFEAAVTRDFDVNHPAMGEDAACSSSPNSSTVSSFQLELSAPMSSGGEGGVAGEGGTVQAVERSSRGTGSDDEENGGARKKLRLSKDQSAFLEENFKEHATLNPKQKLALANQLNLRPRQVEVWFQNRRARTKLKQTEVDCEYLKRCCEKLSDENRRLQKELAELRALKTSSPCYMNLPATTLSMCPSCERVAPTNNSVNFGAPSAPANLGEQRPNSFASLFSKSRLFAGQPLSQPQRPKAAS